MRRCLPALALLAAIGCGNAEPARQVTLVARGMTFVLEGAADAPNPRIPMRTGERIRLVLKNDAPGLLHDVEIPALDVRVDQIRAGQSTDITFTVPDKPGEHEYRCRPHAEMMHGVVEVSR